VPRFDPKGKACPPVRTTQHPHQKTTPNQRPRAPNRAHTPVSPSIPPAVREHTPMIATQTNPTAVSATSPPWEAPLETSGPKGRMRGSPSEAPQLLPPSPQGGEDRGEGLPREAPSLSPPPPHQCPVPDPQCLSLLPDLLNPSLSSTDLCHIHNLTLPQLDQLINSDEIQHQLAAAKRIAQARAEAITACAAPRAAAALADLTEATNEETRRKAATKLLGRTATQPKPAPRPKTNTVTNPNPGPKTPASRGTLSATPDRRPPMRTALAAAFLAAPAAVATPDSDRFSWSENTGWLNWQGQRDPDGTVTGYGRVRFYDNHLRGWIWGENMGWINLGQAGPYAEPALQLSIPGVSGVNVGPIDANGLAPLSGFAWGENVGFINFGPFDPAVTDANGDTIQPRIDTNASPARVRGFAWAENIGWINLGDAIDETGVVTGPADSFGAQVFCRGDLATPIGVLDLADVDAFITGFLAGEPRADLVQPFDLIDLADIDEFINAFSNGCP